jgi:hypothetical protein
MEEAGQSKQRGRPRQEHHWQYFGKTSGYGDGWDRGVWGKIKKGFARGSLRSVLLPFFQFYVEYYLRKNKIVVPFFCQLINFYELIVRF